METTDKQLPFRGAIRAALGHNEQLVFVTVHPEGQPTALYRLDVDKGELHADALPAGGVALAAADGQVFVAGSDGLVYRAPLGGGAPAPLGDKLAPPPCALAALSGGRLAVLSGAKVAILDRRTGARIDALSLPEEGTALAADASGTFLVAGTARGTVAVFEAEGRREILGTAAKKLHEGAVSALLFDPDEPRVYSAGADSKLLLTHVRGELEPEDRAGGAAHDGPIQAIALGPTDKLYTAGRDGALKTWSRAQKRRASTLKDSVGVAIARVAWKGRPHLALFAEDASIRLFPLDDAGKVGERARVFRDAYALAERAFTEDAAAREAALRALAGYNDARAIALLDRRASEDQDPSLRALAAELLGASQNPRAGKALERLIQAGEEQVRLAALSGLRAIEGDKALRPLELALGAQKRDVGVAAVKALAGLARADDQAMARLIEALGDDPAEVRTAALTGLEALFAPTDPEPLLTALRSKRADVRRLALVRGYQQKLLDAPAFQAALRRHQADPDADVRRAAFLVAVMTRPALAEALRARDRDLGRQLGELDTSGQQAEASTAAPAAKAEPRASKSKKAKAEPLLTEADLRPLLEAMASRALDTCLLGARGLAALQDPRAFGTLLQLTSDPSPQARVEACKALSELCDPRGAPRLRQMLRDAASEVRDAAFSALTRLEAGAPLAAAEAGLLSPNDDVRGRGLELLVRQLKKEPPRGLSAPAVALLERALNDPSAAVRGEAFKAALGVDLGGGDAPLRFALRSIHAEVRREVLGEVMGRIQEPWAEGLLLELFRDPDAAVRGEAFAFAQKRGKGRALEPLAAAIHGPHADLKLKAIAALEKRRDDGARALLERALDDADAAVRVAAVDALPVEEAAAAMESAHPDVRVRASASRARIGDPRALAPLVAFVTEREPELAAGREAHVDRLLRALRGLGELGAPEALGPVAALVAHKDKRVSVAAVEALGWVSRPGGDLGPLRTALAHPDADIKREAALGLAEVSDPAALPVLKGLVEQRGEVALRALYATLALGDPAHDLLLSFLDHADEKIRARALLLLLLLASSEEGGAPGRCLGALSSSHPRLRLTAARALEALEDPRGFSAFVAGLLNDRGDDRAAFAVAPDVARALALLVARAEPHLKARAARLLDALDDDKQDRFDRAFDAFRRRFAAPLDALLANEREHAPAPPRYAPGELRRVVLGAYAGLSRMAGGNLEARVRQTAVARLAEMARVDASLRAPVVSVVLLALGDPSAAVRKLAFDSLAALSVDAAELGAEALAVGHRDMGVSGLKLLAAGAKGAARRRVLEQVLLGNTDGLEEEAQRLLAEELGWVPVLVEGLAARAPSLRERSVAGLAERWDEGEAPRAALRGALASRYRHVRERAAIELASKKDPAAFDALVAMLEGDRQAEAIDALVRLGDDRAASALLDRIERDPAGAARVDALLAAAGSFRKPESAGRLLALLDDKKKRSSAFAALLAVSGYDQPILDPDDEGAARPGWEAQQHPRRDALLAALLDASARLGDAALLAEVLPRARFARGPEVGPALAALAAHAKDDVRDRAVEALGFRLQKRGGPAEPLVTALSHPSPKTQLIAAEGLARAGRAEGLRVLLAAIDTLPELDDRRRAVRALGVLADGRAIDPLLRLVSEDGHALQEEAAEAIGHLAATPRAPQIEALLVRLARGPAAGIAQRALTGLRWFGSREGWRLIRSYAADDRREIRLKVAELLAFDAEPEGRDALVRRIEEDSDIAVARRAAESLRKQSGPDAIEPDYALVRARYAGLEERTVERLKERGDPARLLDLLPRIPAQHEGAYLRPLVTALLARDPLPVEAAAARLESPHERVAEVAAQILGRAGKAAREAHGTMLERALAAAARAFQRALSDVDRGKDALAPHAERYRRMIAAAGKLEIGAAEVTAAAALGGEDPLSRPLRLEALRALASGYAGPAGLDALAARVKSVDGRERAFAAAALARLAPGRAAALAAELVDDRASLDRLLAGDASRARAALRAAAARVHTQGAALPLLVASGDVEGLAAALADRALSEAARLGAVEALAKIGTEAARAPILAVAKDEAEDEDLRKAAFRALRRARRYEEKRRTPAQAGARGREAVR